MFETFLRSLFGRRPNRRPAPSCRLGIETLEGRYVPATAYSLQWLGAASAGDNYSVARAINDNGQVVGASGVMNAGTINGATNVLGPYQAYSWTSAGGMVGLGTLTGSESYALALNNSGMIAGYWHYYTIPYTPNGGGYYEWAFTGQNGVLSSIPGHAQIGAHSTANGINNAGVVTGSTDVSTGLPAGQHQAFTYDGTTFTLLGTLGGLWSYGMGVNNVGTVVGMADTGLGVPTGGATAVAQYHAFEWTAAGGMKDIGTLGGQSYANKINDSGAVVGYSEATGANGSITAYHPFLYDGTKMIDIAGGVAGNSFANSINNLGQVVGSESSGNAAGQAAWIYENGTTTDLNTLIPAGAGTLTEAFDINNKGQIVGLGMHNGHYDSFLLTPTTSAAAAPTIAVSGGTFAYNGTAHAAAATAAGAGNAAVAGSFAFTYNGSSTAPTNAGVYSVVATFTSADPNYANATATGTLTISPAVPTLSVTGGTFAYDGTVHAASATAVGVGNAAVSGSFAFAYNGSSTAPANAGAYSVVATFTSADPNYANATANGTLTIGAVAPAFGSLGAPSITQGTASVTIAGTLAAGTLFPTGDSVSITFNGVTQSAVVDASGKFSSTFSAAQLTPAAYPVAFSFAGDGANFSAAANAASTVTVTAPKTTTNAPVVTLDPQSQTALDGKSVTFAAAATGTPTPTVQWQVSRDGGKTFKNIVGATGTSLTIAVHGYLDGRAYRAVFANASGTATTQAAVLTVQTPPKVTQHPHETYVLAGALATFTAAAKGNPAVTIQWQVSTDGGKTWTDVAGATGAKLTFKASIAQNGYKYRAEFSNVAGTTFSKAAEIHVFSTPAGNDD